jgi:hypothetical protein
MRAMVERAVAQADRVARASRVETLAVQASPSEHQEAVALMELVRAHEADYPELTLFHAIPNGGDRHKATAGKMRAEGVRAGVPDYALPVARDGHHGLYIELKKLDGYASREQKDWIQRLRDQGYRAEVARGCGQAWNILCAYLGIRL